jgi:peptidoglycan hydrolase-like protein with peptidoglycan-binding domain
MRKQRKNGFLFAIVVMAAVVVGAPASVLGQAEPVTLGDIQQLLADFGYDPGSLDGVMGPQTREAIRRFQQDQGLRADGRLDGATFDALVARPPGVGLTLLPPTEPRRQAVDARSPLPPLPEPRSASLDRGSAPEGTAPKPAPEARADRAAQTTEATAAETSPRPETALAPRWSVLAEPGFVLGLLAGGVSFLVLRILLGGLPYGRKNKRAPVAAAAPPAEAGPANEAASPPPEAAERAEPPRPDRPTEPRPSVEDGRA